MVIKKQLQKHLVEAKAAGLEIIGNGKNANYRKYKIIDCGHTQEIRAANVKNNRFRCKTCLSAKLKVEAIEAGLQLIGPGIKGRTYQFIKCGHIQDIQISQVRSKSPQCRTCFDEKLNDEAKTVGLEIVGVGKKPSYRKYKIIKCNHFQEITISNVRANEFQCRTCINEKLTGEARANGLELIGSGRTRHYRMYKFFECHHIQEFTLSSVRKHKLDCKLCWHDSLKNEAKAVGLQYIDEAKSKGYRIYEFNTCSHKQEIQAGHVRNKSFHCKTCVNEKLQCEAGAVGLELIGKGKNKNNRTYKFTECGHIQVVGTGSVRLNNFNCNVCWNEKLKNEARAAGVEIIGDAQRHGSLAYKFIECGHVQEIIVHSVRNNSFHCDTCSHEKLLNEARAAGLEFIGDAVRDGCRSYKFIKCGHIQVIYLDCVRNLSFKCKSCFDEKIYNEAKAAGLELIGPGKNSHYRTYKIVECGHVKKLQLTHVRDKTFQCQICETTSRTQLSYVYLLKIQINNYIWLKLGYSKVIVTRAKQYGLPSDASIQEMASVLFSTGNEANKKESALHKKYKHKRLSAKLMKKYHTSSGYNECYPIDMLELLKCELLAFKKSI